MIQCPTASYEKAKFLEPEWGKEVMDNTQSPLNEPDTPDKIDDSDEQIIPLDEMPPAPERIQAQLPFAKRLTLRQRKVVWRLSIALCLLLLIVLVVPGGLPGIGNATIQLYNRVMPPPTPTIAPGLDSFYFDVNIPWTQVTIDGRNIHIPTIGSGAPVRLAIGKHMVSWKAAPFQAQSCTITVPVQFYLNDTCVLTTDDLRSFSHTLQAQLLVLHESISTLSVDQQVVLTDAIQKTLDQQDTSTTVQQGETYFGPKGDTSAQELLRATLRFQLDTGVGSASMSVGRIWSNGTQVYTINPQDCQILCSLPWQLRPPSPSLSQVPAWWTFAFTFLSWNYFTLDGQAVSLNQPLDGGGASAYSHTVLLGLSWYTNAWHIQVFFKQDIAPFIFSGQEPLSLGAAIYDNPACAAAQDLLSDVSGNFTQVRYVADTNPASGCLAIAKWIGSTPEPDRWYFEHFGTLYTANAAAHQATPDFPQADAYEQHLAQQLSMLPGVVVNLVN